MTVLVRPLRAADLDRVAVLEVELFGRSAWSYGMLAEELGALGRWYITAEAVPEDRVGAGDVVGYAGLWFDGELSQIMTIGVSTASQGSGVGSRLLEALVVRSRELGAQGVLLEVAVTNGPAIAMYEKFGFERLGVRKRYYQPEDVDAYTMRLDLPHGGGAPDPGHESAPTTTADVTTPDREPENA
ncbi:ribosomal protein S18-alanine N-acetyltransferase [Sanguibacter antarcticus]|uniref:Ribosomal-protein-alanine N-acetyltransferase n=1 Tax=Sanguibacter antarcticus TaxID=372484 RepID=A0A2A9E543_9MICO|nr:ribosomal protein S18-alanine N-acetyltransferase [Sanguibacter antarcticus]PFG33974.1 ribosomal-protein-alanine N-acetyltransferase [Sanguibacter antarcticus]